MRLFSSYDVDRVWSQDELGSLSELDLTRLALRRSIKNIIFFAIIGAVVYFIAFFTGMFGRILACAVAVLLCLLAIEPLAALAINLFTVVTKPNPWRLLQAVVSAATFILMLILAGIVYAGAYGFHSLPFF